MAEQFPNLNDNRAMRPAGSLRAITIAGSPDVNYSLPNGACKALWINDSTGGNIGIIAENDTSAVVVKVSGPTLLPIRVIALQPSTTTVTDIVALY